MPCRGELAKFVADHRFGDEDGNMLSTVVHANCVADHLREDRRCPGPRADHGLLSCLIHLLDPLEESLLHERPLLARPTQRALPYLASLSTALAAADDQFV
jgi:hypothetical protein